ncbi:peptidase G2 autoproteolytic cleavage domain-containing protein [Providencia rettgeri]|nr:peptidase G2 autoproteolytic cleavage domain-containing protein [Providencia rettgeri]
MTVSTEISSNEYTGNGVTTDFDYKFRIFKANQLSVITSDADGDNVVTLRLGTDYTVTNANKAAGGKVILTKPLANGHKISIARDIPIKQETSFRNQSKFFAETHEDAFDYLTMILQRIWGSLGSLYLKRPNILANWFDAKGYRIANLGKPKRDSDAVDLGTLKDEISGVNSTILKKEKRTLRVDDMDIAAFPKATERRNKQIGFDDSGFPTLLDPVDTGSLGYQLVDSFEKGATLTGRFQVLFWEEKKEYFRWDGVLPKVVPPNSTPNETGGIKTKENQNGLWVSIGDNSVRAEINNIERNFDTVFEMLSASGTRDNQRVFVNGFHNKLDGGYANWHRDETLDGGVYTGLPEFKNGKIVIYSRSGLAYVLDTPIATQEVDLRKIGARESEHIDYVFSVATAYCKSNQNVKRIVIIGNYTHEKPLVIPERVEVDYLNHLSSSTTKVTNNTSGLPVLTGSYGGDLVMDVDACIILDHGYGAKLNNFNIKCNAPNIVEHGIYHGFTREVIIADTVGRIGESGTNKLKKVNNAITAAQGYFHVYGNVTSFANKRVWNYLFNTAGVGCNVIKIRQAWNYSAEECVMRFQGSANVSLGQQYCEDTKGQVYEFYGCTGASCEVLSIDRHECNSIAPALRSRNSQIDFGAITVNAITVKDSDTATFIDHTSSGGIYGCLTINGITARPSDRNIANLTTLVKSRDNCVIRGTPIPPIGALGNIGGSPNSLWSAETDTGRATTDQNRTLISSYECQASGVRSTVANSYRSLADKEGSTVLSSSLVRAGTGYEVCGGYGGSSGENISSANRKWSLDSSNGNIRAAGAIVQGVSFSDYAEYFENAEYGVIPLGTIVELVGDKVTPANGDGFVGVISGTAGIALNASALCWNQRYLVGAHGEPIYEIVDGYKVRKENPDYDPYLDRTGDDIYLSREDRPEEWSCVGMLGQVYVNIAMNVAVGDYITAKNGVGIKSQSKTKLKVMKITNSGIAKCVLL